MSCPDEPRRHDAKASDVPAGDEEIAVAQQAERSVPLPSGRQHTLESRVVRAAEAALAEKHYVSAVDVLVGVGWLPPSRLKDWRQGRCDCLERVVQVNLHNLSDAMTEFHRWACANGLLPRETAYVAQTRDRHPLRFSVSGNPKIEQNYRMHWVSPELSARKRERLAARQDDPPELVVISPLHDWTCARCGGSGPLLFMEDSEPHCLRCAGLDHLVFLPAGDAGLTRRAQRASTLSAVVVRFSRSRKRYERQGLLVEESALAQAKEVEPSSRSKTHPQG